MNIIIEAARFATFHHNGTLRKYTGKPYISHPARVAGLVSWLYPAVTEEMVAAAWLHDTIEDCEEVSKQVITDKFGTKITELVWELTNNSKWILSPNDSRAERKEWDIRRVSGISPEAKIIKVADRVDNLRECPVDVEEGRQFMVEKYYNESVQLYERALKDIDFRMNNILKETLVEVNRKFFGF